MRSIEHLVEEVQREAKRAEFPVDTEVYKRAERDPTMPILYAGSLTAPVCIMGRDLGKDEVAAAEPLIGAGGRLVRAGLYESSEGKPAPASDRKLESVLPLALLTNTVPYKPPGNKAYSTAVKERFRPFVAELLAQHWRGGDRLITLGTEAFQWFAPYAEDPAKFIAFWEREDRYESEIVVQLQKKRLSILPLPHPSPLNARWYKKFPALLAQRLGSHSG